MTVNLDEFVGDLKTRIRQAVKRPLEGGYIGLYEEKPFDEENQKYIILIEFNQGDIRELKITLDINPDLPPE